MISITNFASLGSILIMRINVTIHILLLQVSAQGSHQGQSQPPPPSQPQPQASMGSSSFSSEEPRQARGTPGVREVRSCDFLHCFSFCALCIIGNMGLCVLINVTFFSTISYLPIILQYGHLCYFECIYGCIRLLVIFLT